MLEYIYSDKNTSAALRTYCTQTVLRVACPFCTERARSRHRDDFILIPQSTWVQVVDDSGVPDTPVEPNRDWMWNEARIQILLSTEDTEVLFLGGCSPNMGKLLPQFDCVILLSAPTDVLVERLRTRTNNPYGKHQGEVERVLELVESVEPLLRKAADYEIDTSASLDEIVATVLALGAAD